MRLLIGYSYETIPSFWRYDLSLCQDVDTDLADPNPASKPPIGGQNGPQIENYVFFFSKYLGAILKKLYSMRFLFHAYFKVSEMTRHAI